jgi:LuxR family maltose regulon positive regulatory protein
MNEPPGLENQVLATKLMVPRMPRALVERPRLDALLDLGCAKKSLTLVSAPAGFGKTTMLAHWVQRQAAPFGEKAATMDGPPTTQALHSDVVVAWVSLDPGDNNPRRFWLHLFSALERQLPGHVQSALPLLDHNPDFPINALTVVINALAAQNARCILVLDDYHVISEPQIQAALAFLIEHQPPQLHLIIATRTTPQLPLARLRANAAIQELREEHLRCTSDEATAFFTEVMGIQLAPATLKTIAERTEGWLVGLQLIGIWLQQHVDTERILTELRGSHRYILDYVTEQVLDQQTAPVRRFLLCTSILDQLSADLCAAVIDQTIDENESPSPQEMLELLERANVFVVALDGQRQWYRYHALFAEALRYRLEQEDSNLAQTLHWRASRWYAERDQGYEAIQHALLSRNWDWTADLAADALRLPYTRPGEATSVLSWIGQLPIEVMARHLQLCKAYGTLLMWANHYHRADRWLHEIEVALALQPEPLDPPAIHERTRLLGWVVACQACVAVLLGRLGSASTLVARAQHDLDPNLPEYSMLTSTQGWLAHADGDIERANYHFRTSVAIQRQYSRPEVRIGTLAIISQNLQIQGRFRDAWAHGQQIIDLAHQSNQSHSAHIAFGYVSQATILYEWNRLAEAHALALHAYNLAETSGLDGLVVLINFALVAIHLAQGDLSSAERFLQQIERSRIYAESVLYRAQEHELWQVRLWLMRGDVERAGAWATTQIFSKNHESCLVADRQQTMQARVALAQGDAERALALLEPLLIHAQQQERWRHVLEQRVLQACAYQLHQQTANAQQSLAHALQIGAPEGYLRSFVDEGPQVAELLRQLPTSPYRDRVLAACSAQPLPNHPTATWAVPVNTARPSLVEPLTEREHEVLQLLAQGSTNQEIAAALIVTPSTIKNHLSRIFGKLGVSNRTQAVAYARTLGLFDPAD